MGKIAANGVDSTQAKRKSVSTPKKGSKASADAKRRGTTLEKLESTIRRVGSDKAPKNSGQPITEKELAVERDAIQLAMAKHFEKCVATINADRLVDVLIVDPRFTSTSYFRRLELVEPVLELLPESQFCRIISLGLKHPAEVG